MALNKQMLEENEMNGYAGYARNDQYNPASVRSIAEHYRAILKEIGENPEREGLKRTPERVAMALQFLTTATSSIPRRSCARRCSARNTSRW